MARLKVELARGAHERLGVAQVRVAHVLELAGAGAARRRLVAVDHRDRPRLAGLCAARPRQARDLVLRGAAVVLVGRPVAGPQAGLGLVAPLPAAVGVAVGRVAHRGGRCVLEQHVDAALVVAREDRVDDLLQDLARRRPADGLTRIRPA